MSEPLVLGLNLSHNGAAAIVHGDRLVVAVQEERLTRRKAARIRGSRRAHCIDYCMQAASIAPSDLDLVVVATQGRASASIDDVYLNPQLRLAANGVRMMNIGHHFAHAWSAYACSGFSESAILVVDGLGSPFSDLDDSERELASPTIADPWETASIYQAVGNTVRPVWKDGTASDLWLAGRPRGMAYFGSLGGMYESVADLLFRDNLAAGKVMGLAPYGTPTYTVEQFLSTSGYGFTFFDDVPNAVDPDLNLASDLRAAENLAASVQQALEYGVMWLVRRAREMVPSDRFCYAGGVALNSVANQQIYAARLYSDHFIVPAAEDSGVAVGAAYYGAALIGHCATRSRLLVDCPGAEYAASDVDDVVRNTPCVHAFEETVQATAQRLADGQIVGFFSGGSEFGPRSLGYRSILADARSPEMKDRVNARIKHREPFRPFAPAVLESEAAAWFDFQETDPISPFMLRVVPVRSDKAALVPAIVHVDGSARVQTVSAGSALHQLLEAFFQISGVPLLLNTSFNVMSEPIVETPDEALLCLLEEDLDAVRFDDRTIMRDAGFNPFDDLFPISRELSRTVTTETSGVAKERGASATFVRRSSRWGPVTEPLNPTEVDVIDRCDGSRSVRAIHAEVATESGRPSLQDIFNAIVGLRRRGLVGYARQALAGATGSGDATDERADESEVPGL